jgi:Spy/CpxP family protein refolding chaperone
MMNRWIRRAMMSLSITSAVALVGGVALAHHAEGKGHGQRAGLLGQALKLDSLTPEQRTAVGQLVEQRRAARVPVREADARVLTALAQGVEQASVDPQALAPALNAEDHAAAAQTAVERDALNRLHALLTPAQRSQLVDRIEAEHSRKDAGGDREPRGAWGGKLGLTPEQKTQIAASLHAGGQSEGGTKGAHEGEPRQALEGFRGDSFDASGLVRVEHRGERAEKLAEAMVPVLTPAQRGEFAKHLRARAAHESHS